jgi:hypothetical protein
VEFVMKRQLLVAKPMFFCMAARVFHGSLAGFVVKDAETETKEELEQFDRSWCFVTAFFSENMKLNFF